MRHHKQVEQILKFVLHLRQVRSTLTQRQMTCFLTLVWKWKSSAVSQANHRTHQHQKTSPLGAGTREGCQKHKTPVVQSTEACTLILSGCEQSLIRVKRGERGGGKGDEIIGASRQSRTKYPPRTQPRETGSATVSTLMQKKLCVIPRSYVVAF